MGRIPCTLAVTLLAAAGGLAPAPARAAVAPAGFRQGLEAPAAPPAPMEAGILRVDDGTSWPGYDDAMRATQILPDGAALRFDPADSFDEGRGLPRPFRVLRIHVFVESDQGTGPLTVSLCEDNGGHKPDEGRVLMTTIATAGPGDNVIDLVALGLDVLVDPPRMIQLVFRNQGRAGAPWVAADDGLPYVGGSGDFHTSINYVDANCGVAVFGFAPPSDGAGSHSSNLMAWLDVDFVAPAPAPLFTKLAGMGGCGRCAWGDADGDGDPDALNSGSQLWLNQGDGTFRDVTSQALPSGQRGIGGGLFADFDDDGDLDWFGQTSQCWRCPTNNPIPQGQKVFDTIMRNVGDTNADGVPEFEDVRTVDFGNADDAPVPGDPDPTEGSGIGDFNGDGWIDVYIGNHNDWTTYDAFLDHLWINDGPPAFTFTDASAESGVLSALLHARGVAPADYDFDGDADIFVSNYVLDRDLLWENRGVDADDLPRFTNVGGLRGVEGTQRMGVYGHGIGAAWGDVSGDGALDLLVGNLAHSAWLCFSDTTKLYVSRGAAGSWAFDDIREASGIAYNEVHSDASFADFDNDGDLDVVITHVYDGWRTSVYENLGTDPPTFRDAFAAAGIDQRAAWGSAWADFDRDGDLDLWMSAGLYVNRTVENGSANHWVELRLSATTSNPQSIGARITVEAGGRTFTREVFGARGTTSQDDLVQHVGLGGAATIDRLHVRWPSGCELELLSVAPDRVIDLVEPACLVPRMRMDGEARPLGRPQRVACAGVRETFRDDSVGSPISWAWDLDGNTSIDATTPVATFTYPRAGLFQVSLTVDDGTGPRTITRELRADEAPIAPAAGTVTEPGGNFCISELLVEWDPATWGPAGPGVYNVYRGLDAADAVSRPPLALGLASTSWTDTTTEHGIPYVYVVEAEDPMRPGGCSRGPDHGGNTARLVLAPGVADQVQVPLFLGPVTARDLDPCAASGILLEWPAATFFGTTRTGTYHVYRLDESAGRCPDPFVRGQSAGDPRLVTGLTGTTYIDSTAASGTRYVYLVQAEDARSRPCVNGPLNNGPSSALCATSAAEDVVERASADAGDALRVTWNPAGTALDWTGTTVTPGPGEAWGMLAGDVATGPWTLLPPGRLAVKRASDPSAPGIPLRFYLATLLSPNDCPGP